MWTWTPEKEADSLDNSSIHPASRDLAHLVDLFTFQGAPHNQDPDHEIQILVNHGYVVGYSPTRLQPAWAAYRVAGFEQDFGFDRPHLYYEDHRLDPNLQIGSGTFGQQDGVRYHVGHMVPNEVINRQFGRLAQMETFFMSNMSPQRGSLNTGVWLALENSIRKIEDTPDKDHVWAIVGPIFGDAPAEIVRPNGLRVPIPDAYYCLTVDPFRYPWDRESNVDIACLRIPQSAPGGTPLPDFLTDLAAIEAETKLDFFPRWSTDLGDVAPPGELSPARSRHRLLDQFV